jgi:CDP-4-dehydro-6-deoxyglucose reductase, E3
MPYQVTIKDSGRQFMVEADMPVLSAALAQGMGLPYGCQSGNCGACRAKLISGNVHYSRKPDGLSDMELRQGYTLLCQAQAQSDLVLSVEELPQHHAIRVRNLPVRVARRERLSHDVMALYLQLPNGMPFEFLAGQYVDILLADGRRRSFSLASAPAGAGQVLELHLRHVAHGQFTDYVFNQMPDLALLRIEGPLGNFYLRESDRPAILIGGGTGFAPLKGMLEQAFLRRLSRPLHLYCGVRAKRDLYMDALAREWRRAHPQFRYTPVLSDPQAGDAWAGRSGLVHEAVATDYPTLNDHEVYMSGPPAMIQAGKTCFAELGLSLERLHYDSFDYAYQTWPGKG